MTLAGVGVNSAAAAPKQASVQAQIDSFLTKHKDAAQTGPDEVSWNDGAVVMTWPDPSTGKVRPAQAANNGKTDAGGEIGTMDVNGCPEGYTVRDAYCFYEHSNFAGRMLKFYDCGGQQYMGQYGFNDKTSSWVNTINNTVIARDFDGTRHVAMWYEQPRTKSSYVGNTYNDRLDAFTTICP